METDLNLKTELAPMKPDRRILADQWAWKELKTNLVPTLPIRKSKGKQLPKAPIVVAIIDSGVNKHAELIGYLSEAPAHSVIGGDPHDDDDDHGTPLAGMICGVTDDQSSGGSGLKILPVKFCSQRVPPSADNAAAAINYACKKGAQVIVLAWDCGFATGKLNEAIANAKGQALIVAAAGNHAMDNDLHPNWPANYSEKYDHVITVMATDKHKERASFSNYGKTTVDVAAPGVAILSTVPYYGTPIAGSPIPVGYRFHRGTSAATAFVARLAALILERKPMTPEELKQHLRNKVSTIPSLAKWCSTGGIVDYEKAFK